MLFAPLIAPALTAAVSCFGGRVEAPATDGHCCWPGQTWSRAAAACTGAPACPGGTSAAGNDCLPDCEAGRVRSVDTAGHCCWPRQAWVASRQTCLGVPECPAGLRVEKEECVIACEPGRVTSVDTAGHCCWPEQAWAQSRQQCIGAPRCPDGLAARGETCEAPVAVAAPPDAGTQPLAASIADAGAVAALEVPGPGPAPAAASVATTPATTAAPPASVASETPVAAPSRGPPWYFFLGVGVFVIGYLPALIVPAVFGQNNPNASRVAPIPLLGPILVRDTLSDYALRHDGLNAATVVVALVQWAGAACIAGGGAVWVKRLLADAPVKVAVTPAGASASW